MRVTSARFLVSESMVPEVDEDDTELLRRIREGDRTAFAHLVKRHAGRCYKIAYRFMHERTEAEDMIQDAFLKLWERPQMWQEDRQVPFICWFHRVIVNLCLDRRKKKQPALLVDDTWVIDDRETQEDALMRRQQQHRMEGQLEAEIAALPERQRVALNLCFSEGLSNQEAADVMEIHLKALQSLLMRAKTTLKKKLRNT